MKYKEGDRVRIKSLDWYNKNKGNADETNSVWCEDGGAWFFYHMSQYCGKIMTIKNVWSNSYTLEGSDSRWTDEMIEGLVEDETSKFKVNDIVFVKNIGWVRITNSYWDSLANEYIYEAIGFNGEGEYDSINQSNIECQMLPESENPPTCGNKITLDEYKNNDKEWLFNKLAMLDNITALESIQDIFNHLQQSKYPKTYEECCYVLGFENTELVFEDDYRNINPPKEQWKRLGLINQFNKLLICRDAYWKIAGEEMGLGKSWRLSIGKPFYYLYYNRQRYCIRKDYADDIQGNVILPFPTEEMRNAFFENLRELIEECKELL